MNYLKGESEVAQSCPTLRPHGLEPTRLLCPWDSPGNSIGVDCHFLLQGNLPDPGIKPGYPILQADTLSSEPCLKKSDLTFYSPNHYFLMFGGQFDVFIFFFFCNCSITPEFEVFAKPTFSPGIQIENKFLFQTQFFSILGFSFV